MANLDGMFHFERFVPNIGNNRQLREQDQLALELATGLTINDLSAFSEQTVGPRLDSDFVAAEAAKRVSESMTLNQARIAVRLDGQAAALEKTLAPFVRLERGGHSIGGRAVGNLYDYLRCIIEQPGGYNFTELNDEVLRLNSATGTRALFSEPLSGGRTSTAAESTAKDESRTAAH